MPITKKEVTHVAALARLALTEKDAELYTAQLQRILSHVEKLSTLDTNGTAPMTHLARKLLRDDSARSVMPHEDAVKNSPETERGYFKVPRIIE
ncbi:MAG: Asp-tRNA(Asn)/Glu-tRNA(Gln) amidotransferase subunit GatC [Deltaproteobacteria bacterium]|nr:Asp-tRNA(Asn)/Glu-tRNA(Gln) amidotransferase subunit GatC [Deltaproteobacteria bacterium]